MSVRLCTEWLHLRLASRTLRCGARRDFVTARVLHQKVWGGRGGRGCAGGCSWLTRLTLAPCGDLEPEHATVTVTLTVAVTVIATGVHYAGGSVLHALQGLSDENMM